MRRHLSREVEQPSGYSSVADLVEAASMAVQEPETLTDTNHLRLYVLANREAAHAIPVQAEARNLHLFASADLRLTKKERARSPQIGSICPAS